MNGFERADRAAAASPRGPGRFLPVRVEPPRRWALASRRGFHPMPSFARAKASG